MAMELAASRSCAAATRYQRLQRTAGNARQRRNATATSCRPRQEQRSPRLSVSAVFADATGFRERQLADAAGAGDAAADSTLQELNAASHDPAAFAAVLHRLTERGGGGTVPTEAHVVAAWAAQRRNPALHAVRGSLREADVLRGLAALEELTRRQLVSLTADQIGFVYRCYVLAGGSSKPLLQGLQQAASSWRAEEYSAAGFAELAWALASSPAPVSEACRQLLHNALQGPRGQGSVAEQQQQQRQGQQGEEQQQQQTGQGVEAAQAPQQERQRVPGVQQRDWGAWFAGTPASRVVLLLWAAPRLGCHPCRQCMQAAARAALRPAAGLAKLPTKSLVTLLWALATLRAQQQLSLVRATTQQLGDRLEAQLGSGPGEKQMPPPAAAAVAAPPADGLPSGDGSSSSFGDRGTLGGRTASSGKRGGDAAEEEEEDEALLAGAATAGSLAVDSEGEGWHSDSAPAASSISGGDSSTSSTNRRSSPGHGRSGEPPGKGSSLDTSMLSTAVWACGQLRHADTRLLQAAAEVLQAHVGDMSAGNVARVLWGLAQLGHAPAPLLSAVTERLQVPGVLAGFSVSQLALSTSAFVALDVFPGQRCVDLLADACLAARRDFAADPRSFSNVLWNMARLGHVDEPFYLAFVPVVLSSIEHYGPSELADVARVYSRAGLNPESQREGQHTLFDALATQTVARIQGAELQDVLRIMTAFHEMGLQPEELLAAVEGWANRRLRALSPQALSLALWSFARMGSSSPALLETAGACAEAQLDNFSPSQLAQVAWSLAKLRWPAPRVLRHAGTTLAQRTDEFSDKAASNVLWALASQGEHLPREVLDGIAARLQPRLQSFGPQSLANIAWAYATLAAPPSPPFLTLLGDAALRRLPACEPQGLSMLVWSLASLGCRHDALLGEIVRLCGERPALLRQFEGQHLANLLWGLCRAGFRPHPAFLQHVAKEAQLRVADLKPQELFNIAWSYSQLGHHPGPLLDAIAAEVVPRAFAFSPQELSGTLWALAKARHSTRSTRALLDAVEGEVSARAASFEPRHLAVVAWSAGQLGWVMRPAALQALLAALLPEALEGRSLATLVEGLAAMERQRWRQQPRHTVLPPLVPPLTSDALAERCAALVPTLQPFEFAQLAAGFAALGSPAARRLFLEAPDVATRSALNAAVRKAPLPAVVSLLWAMARWDCYPSPAYPRLADRLCRTSPQYRLAPASLVLLGQALGSMPARQLVAMSLRSGLRHAALEAAAAAAAAAAASCAASSGASLCGSSSDSSSNAGGEGWTASSQWTTSTTGSSSSSQGGTQQRWRQTKEAAAPVEGGSLRQQEEDEAELQGL